MRNIILSLVLCLLLVGIAFGQDNDYELALQLIEEARITGATNLSLFALDLRELPPEIGSLEQLEILTLTGGSFDGTYYLWSGRGLTALPPEIGNLVNLRELYVGKNQLRELPPEIGNLVNLETLVVSHNALERLPVEIGNLVNLDTLVLSYNQLERLPSEMNKLGTLRILLVDHNPFSSVPRDVIMQGGFAVLDYQVAAARELQGLVAKGAGSIGILATVILGLRWRNYRRNWEKKKNRAKS